jgi:hypothetical protein
VKLILLLLACFCASFAGAQTFIWKPGLTFNGGIPTFPVSNTLSVGSTAAQIQSALNSAPAGTSVFLPSGTYNLGTTSLHIPGLVCLRGSDSVLTYSGTTSPITMGSGNSGLWGSRVSVTGGAVQNSMAITVQSSAGIFPGSVIVISAVNPSFVSIGDLTWGGAPGADGSGNDTSRDMEQVDIVSSVAGNTLNLRTPLYMTYSNTPVVNVSNGFDHKPMIQSIQIHWTGAGADEPDIMIDGAYGACVLECGIVQSNGTMNYAHVMISDAVECEVRECTFTGGGVNTSGLDYGVYLVNNCSETLVEDNVFIGNRHSMLVAAGSSGNVFGYNFASGTFEDTGTGQGNDASAHGAESFMNLWEGNVAEDLYCDNTHGGNAWNCSFRNWFKAWSSHLPAISFRWALSLEASTYGLHLQNDVLGRPGDNTTSDILNSSNWQSTDSFYNEYSFAQGRVITRTLANPPASLYTYKPSWWENWGSINWPANGNDCSPKNGGNPASVRRHDLQ